MCARRGILGPPPRFAERILADFPTNRFTFLPPPYLLLFMAWRGPPGQPRLALVLGSCCGIKMLIQKKKARSVVLEFRGDPSKAQVRKRHTHTYAGAGGSTSSVDEGPNHSDAPGEALGWKRRPKDIRVRDTLGRSRSENQMLTSVRWAPHATFG